MAYWFIRSAFAALLAIAASAAQAGAVADVKVTLQDPSTAGDIHAMQMLVNPSTVAPGTVTFEATNRSKALIHEMLVVKVNAPNVKLPYDPKDAEVIEGRVAKLGEISDLRPGQSGTLTLTLAPGEYVLLCNEPDHYKQGMWMKFIVSG
jgi:uncharacterized cupredoxin-like copper-binding protein